MESSRKRKTGKGTSPGGYRNGIWNFLQQFTRLIEKEKLETKPLTIQPAQQLQQLPLTAPAGHRTAAAENAIALRIAQPNPPVRFPMSFCTSPLPW
jgi:hypothetical protein